MFSCEYCKIFKTTYFEKQLLFYFFNDSLLHGPKGLRSRLYHSIRLQGPSHRSSFCFKSGSLVLEQVSTCIRKPKKIPLISQLSFDIDCFWSYFWSSTPHQLYFWSSTPQQFAIFKIRFQKSIRYMYFSVFSCTNFLIFCKTPIFLFGLQFMYSIYLLHVKFLSK